MHQLTLSTPCACANCGAITEGEHSCLSELQRVTMRLLRLRMIRERAEARR